MRPPKARWVDYVAQRRGIQDVAAIDDLLARITDLALKADLDREIKSLRTDREFGLVFERHLPENVRLPGHPIRRGLTVQERDNAVSEKWVVASVRSGVAKLRRRNNDGAIIEETRPVDELIVVRDFGKPIYPGLRSVGTIERGGDKPFHTVINAENFRDVSG